MNLGKILDEAMRLDASDVHLISGNKPMLRIARDLVPVEEIDELTRRRFKWNIWLFCKRKLRKRWNI